MKQMALIVAAGGCGSRFGTKLPKQFLDLEGKPIIVRAILPFMGIVSKVVISIAEGYEDYLRGIMPDEINDIMTIVPGGTTRYDSVKNALSEISGNYEFVAVHDAARPYVDEALILRVLESASKYGAAIPVVPLVDSIRRVYNDGTSKTRNRGNYAFVQTPQIFNISILKEAYKLPYSSEITDDASLVEMSGHSVYTVLGSPRNIKITYRTDL